MKQIPLASLVNVEGSPNDLSPFITVANIRNKPSFVPWVHQFMQDMIHPGGAHGIVSETNNLMVTVILETMGDGPMLVLPLHSLAPIYRDGNNIKTRWYDLSGIVVSVDEDHSTLTYVERDSNKSVITLMDAVELHDPLTQDYQFKEGAWVEFNMQHAGYDWKRCGFISQIDCTSMLVIDEHSFAEDPQVKVNKHDLDLCSHQGHSLLKGEPCHSLLSKRVMVKHSHCKGYTGHIKDVRNMAITVELDALLTGSNSPC
ncbi:hypothetical protein EI94DRAFT_1699834 [Lactarius quietus]|nr:hypothetical protein EI94DRAFT_1699834 [Lactarius quietus]